MLKCFEPLIRYGFYENFEMFQILLICYYELMINKKIN